MQLNKLKLELRHLASERGSITVVSGSSRSNGEIILTKYPNIAEIILHAIVNTK